MPNDDLGSGALTTELACDGIIIAINSISIIVNNVFLSSSSMSSSTLSSSFQFCSYFSFYSHNHTSTEDRIEHNHSVGCGQRRQKSWSTHLSRVLQQVKLSAVSLVTRPRYSLVVEEDVEKPNNQATVLTNHNI